MANASRHAAMRHAAARAMSSSSSGEHLEVAEVLAQGGRRIGRTLSR
jgi:hypothetical protein